MITEFATIDFETFYSIDFSLSKMQTDEYILDPRFEIILVSVRKTSGGSPEWFSGNHSEVKTFLENAIDWPNTAVCAHHAQFDGFIATQILGLKPALWIDTIPLLRMHYPWWKSYALSRAVVELGLGEKGKQVVTYLGYQRSDFSPEQLADYGSYCNTDVALTHMMASILLPRTPLLELYLIDMATRMFTEPRIVGDTQRLVKYHAQEVERKQTLLDSCSVTKDDLMSNPKLAEVLQGLGIVPPTKISLRTEKTTWAFAKSDKEFTALQQHPDPNVQAIVTARLGVKSTIAETRALRLVHTSQRGPMPVYLKHWGAKVTGRYSGGDGSNWQNIPARGPASEIRYCMQAPPGFKVVVGDSSNIELRFAMCAAGQTDVVDRIRHYDTTNESDVYCDFASQIYGRMIHNTPEDYTERLVGKVGMLSLQYGSGAATFRDMVRRMAGILLTEDEAQNVVTLYRQLYAKVRKLWRYCDDVVLPAIHNKEDLVAVDVNGWMLTMRDGFAVPGHLGVVYHDLKKDSSGSWTYRMGNAVPYLYGGKVVENGCQHGSRHIVMWQAARVHRRYPVSLTVHDEIVCVVPEQEAEPCKAYMEECLSLAPTWCRGQIPLNCEVAIGDSYGEAK